MNAMKFKPALLLGMLAAFAILLAACGGGSSQSQGNGTGSGTSGNGAAANQAPAGGGEEAPAGETDKYASKTNPVVTIETDGGKLITIELYPELAPNTVNNFISLVNKGFYDGTVFHRVIPGFMIQGGDPDGTGMGGPGYGIAGEFSGNGFPNDLKHERGVISMARAQDPNSAGSQFFIMVADAPYLDGSYAAFGKVTSGMEAVDEIVSLPTGANDRPETLPAMKKVTVDTKGIEYAEPETVK
ncbi:peptidylprolyl isomerase [uncultured Paenibacillus sp.]|uniref:peptidylprolyl isomerase n=1 Tax=uncultured Paenibacillus sp. TaxID=227322 RepID=UPI0028D1D7E2|nr:peptidylprolyl isomerase [uncultured Paenibacillus sp.]